MKFHTYMQNDFSNLKVNGQQLFYNIQAFHFRRQSNPDFELPLRPTGTNGVVTNNLGADGFPEYCCGDQPKFANDGTTLLVNNASTFAEWWKGSITEGECDNYGLLLPLILGEYGVPTGGGYFYTTPDYIRNAFTGRGFNNYTEFPQYQADGDVYSFCWKTELDFEYMPGSNVGTISVIYPGEILVYIDGVLQISRLGTTSIGNQLSQITGEQGKTYHMEIFGCDRAPNSLWEINVRFFDIITKCDVNQCGTCGYSVCPETCNNATSCRNLKPACGSCLDEGPKDCELENDGSQPCITYTCIEGSGCVPQDIPNCQCNSTNCESDDFCILAECQDNKCIRKNRDCVLELENCDAAVCVNQKCSCTHKHTPVPSTITTSTTSTSTTSTSTTSTSTTSTSTISTTSTTSTTLSTPTTSTISTYTPVTLTTTSLTTSPSIPPKKTPHPDIVTTHKTIGFPAPTVTTLNPITTYTTLFPPPPPPPTLTSNSIITTIYPPLTTSSTSSSSSQYLCNEYSCPSGYCCVQLTKSFTCVSSYFENQCYIERLQEYY